MFVTKHLGLVAMTSYVSKKSTFQSFELNRSATIVNELF